MAVAPEAEALLRRAYDAVNRKDVDGVLAAAHPEVDWANALEGTREIGVEQVRHYFERQFRVIEPAVEVLSIDEGPGGSVVARVRQSARFASDGAVILDEVVDHIFTFRDGLIETMDVRDGDGRFVAPPRVPSDS